MAGCADCSTFAAASRMYPALVYEWLTMNGKRESELVIKRIVRPE